MDKSGLCYSYILRFNDFSVYDDTGYDVELMRQVDNMKKKIVVLLLTLICILGLTGCGGKDNQEFPMQNASEPEAYYEANKDMYDQERKEKVYSDTTIGFLDACDKYDDAYFERQNLVLIILEEGSGSIRHKITDVRRRWDEYVASHGWNITIKTMAPEVVTDDMAEWHLFLEVQMGNVIKDGDDVWINDKLSSNASEK